MIQLTWQDFDLAIQHLVNTYRHHDNLVGVYGFPRGGLCLAVALSHHLNLPLLHHIEPQSLVVDDIYETGRTLASARLYPNVQPAVWISKSQPSWFHAVKVIHSPDWILFPWENPKAATLDQESYHASRQ